MRIAVILGTLSIALSACCLSVTNGEERDSGTGGFAGTNSTGGSTSGATSGGTPLPTCALGLGGGPGVTTLYASSLSSSSESDGAVGTAPFNLPSGLALGADCSIYISDGPSVWRFDPQGNASLYPGPGTHPGDGSDSIFPNGLAIDSASNLYISDTFHHQIFRLDPQGNLTLLTSDLASPNGVAVDGAGNVYVADSANNRIRKIDTAGIATTLAGNGASGYSDGSGGPNGKAEFFYPLGIAVDSAGNVYVADGSNNRIRKIDPDGNVTTVAGSGPVGQGESGFADGSGGPNGTAEFEGPYAIAIGAAGTLYVSDPPSGRVREIDTAGNVTTLAGNGRIGLVNGTVGENSTSEFNVVQQLAVDANGTVYVADLRNLRVRKIVP